MLCSAYPNRTNLGREALATVRELILSAAAAIPALEKQPIAVDTVANLRNDIEQAKALLAGAAVEEPDKKWG